MLNEWTIIEISDAPIIGLVISIGHYWPLFLISALKDLTDILKSVPIMSFLVIITSFIDTHNYWENAHFYWKNQKPEGRCHIGTYLK